MTFERKTIRILYQKLVALYPKAFREQFGESMDQTFDDLCRERTQSAGRGFFGFASRMFVETAVSIIKEHLTFIKSGKNMENILANHKLSAITSFILVLPLVILFAIAGFEITPLEDWIKAITTEPNGPRNSVFGLVILLGILLLLPAAAFVVALVPVLRGVKAGNGLTAHPANFSVAVVLLIYITMFVGGIAVDQYPCWIGVPNCD